MAESEPDSLNNAKGNPISSYHLGQRLSVAESMIPDRAKRVLDVGCGEGYFLRRLVDKKGVALKGVDISDANLSFARRLVPKAGFLNADARRLPFDDSSFDCVTCLEVLDHFTDSDAILGEARRVLEDGGTLILSVPDAKSPVWNTAWWLWTRTLGRRWLGGHIASFGREALAERLARLDFQKIREKRAFFGLIIVMSAECRKR